MKNEFLDYLEKLMAAAPQVEMSDTVKAYIDALKTSPEKNKPILTDNGKLILQYMRDSKMTTMFKARDIAEGLFISSRTISGAMRKLVLDGFCEKVGADPVIYVLTTKGKEFNLEEGE